MATAVWLLLAQDGGKGLRAGIERLELLAVVEHLVRPAAEGTCQAVASAPPSHTHARACTYLDEESDVWIGFSSPASGMAHRRHKTKPTSSSTYTWPSDVSQDATHSKAQ